jgi:hypothetical protein
MNIRNTCFAIGVALTLLGQPARAERLPVGDFFKDPEFTSVSLSPTGEYITVSKPEGDRTLLAAFRVKDMKLVGKWDYGKNRHIDRVRWVNDERFFMFVSLKLGKLRSSRRDAGRICERRGRRQSHRYPERRHLPDRRRDLGRPGNRAGAALGGNRLPVQAQCRHRQGGDRGHGAAAIRRIRTRQQAQRALRGRCQGGRHHPGHVAARWRELDHRARNRDGRGRAAPARLRPRGQERGVLPQRHR